jgi:hypothetical protein
MRFRSQDAFFGILILLPLSLGACSAPQANGTTVGVASSALADAPLPSTLVFSNFNGKCLSTPSANDYEHVWVYDCNANGGQYKQPWTFTDQGEIRGPGGKCLDNNGSSTANGRLMQIYQCNGSSAQKWKVTYSGAIQNQNSGKCLDIKDRGNFDGALVQQWLCADQPNQTWRYQLPSTGRDNGIAMLGVTASQNMYQSSDRWADFGFGSLVNWTGDFAAMHGKGAALFQEAQWIDYVWYTDTTLTFWGGTWAGVPVFTDLNATLGDPGQVEKVVLCVGSQPKNVFRGIDLFVLANARHPCTGGNCRRDALVHAGRYDGTWTAWDPDLRDLAGDHGAVTDIACAADSTGVNVVITTEAGGLWHTKFDRTAGTWSQFDDLTTVLGTPGVFTHVALTYDINVDGAYLQIMASTSDNQLWYSLQNDAVQSTPAYWDPFHDVLKAVGTPLESGQIVSISAASESDTEFAVVKDSGTPWLTILHSSANRKHDSWEPWFNGAAAWGLPSNFVQWPMTFFWYSPPPPPPM